MKLALITLIATAAAADASDWSTCSKGGDCAGAFICCTVTKTKGGADAPAGEKICVNSLGDGTVPKTVTTPYAES